MTIAVTTSASGISPELRADADDHLHREAVDEHLRRTATTNPLQWASVLAGTQGADPRFVAQRALALGLAIDGLTPPPTMDTRDGWEPELHARDFEWYFTTPCADALVDRAIANGPGLLCLGAPTVAARALAQPDLQRVTLVDRNPLQAQRHRFGPRLQTIIDDLAAARLERGTYDSVIFDAPWYPTALQHWLSVATLAVRSGGVVMFALLPPLHRPKAGDDRRQILAAASRSGQVRVHPGAVRYQTPRFEREALATAGVCAPAAWRTADLVYLTVQRPAPAPTELPAVGHPWLRFSIGSQVVHLDPRAPAEPGDLLESIDGRADFRYGSISTRDPRRSTIGIWTSRSRVASVRRPDVVAAVLQRLADTGDARALAETPELQAMPPAERARTMSAIEVLLGPRVPR